MTKKSHKKAKPAPKAEIPPNPSPTNEATGPSDQGGATSIPPEMRLEDRFKKRVDLTMQDAWRVYLSMQDPVTTGAWSDELGKMGINVSADWLLRKMKTTWKHFKAEKAFMLAQTLSPAKFNQTLVVQTLEKYGKDFDPFLTLQGIQHTIAAVVTAQLPTNLDPKYHAGMVEVYQKWTDELQRTYQYRKRMTDLETPGPPPAKVEPGEQVIPFGRKKTP